MAGPLLPLGVVVASPAALGLLEEHGVDPSELLARHASCDWGDVGLEDWKMNDHDLREGGRLFSAYDTPAGRVCIITETDRSVTTILLPHEY